MAGRFRPLPEAGATVALVAPAFALPDGMADMARERLEALGFTVVPGMHLSDRHGAWAGTVSDRAADLSWALTDAAIDLVWAARGGEGTSAVAACLPWAEIERRPRPVVGMSDLTFLHAALGRRGIASVHGAMPGVGREDWDAFTASAALKALFAPGWRPLPMPAAWPAPRAIRTGAAEGPLVGGNLAVLAAACGTPFMPDTRGAILLLEDVGEAAYRIDRSLTQLAQAGVLDGLAGVALGTWTGCTATADATVDRVLEDHLDRLGVPVLAGLQLGHGVTQSVVVLGAAARLDAAAAALSLGPAPWVAEGGR